jgi:hypothetical protein
MYHDVSWPARNRMPSSAGANSILAELIAVLAPHPKGLRRWSVMRAVRKNREAQSRDIPLKLEADVERIFRQFSSDSADAGMRGGGKALFCRPAETAGEVWALRPDYAETAEPALSVPTEIL